MPKISLYGVGPQFPVLKGPAWRCVFSAVRCTFGVTFPDRAAGQPSQMIGAVGAQTRPEFEFCARPKCTDWNKTRIFALVQLIAINATTLPPIKRRWPYGPGVRSPFSRFLALNAQVLQRGFHSKLHFREGMAEAFTSFFSTCQKSGLKPGPVWPAPFNGWEDITNICIFDFRCALGALPPKGDKGVVTQSGLGDKGVVTQG